MPDHAHPVIIPISDYIRDTSPPRLPLCDAPRASGAHTDGADWQTEHPVAVKQDHRSVRWVAGPMDRQSGICIDSDYPTEDAFSKDFKDIRTNPKYMSSFRAELTGVHDMLSDALKNTATETRSTRFSVTMRVS